MTIKEVVLAAERQRIESFLRGFGLKYESNVDQTIYVEDEKGIIATLSASKYILKCLAVKPEYRSENLAVTLVSEMIKRFHTAGIYYYSRNVSVAAYTVYAEVEFHLHLHLLYASFDITLSAL